MKWIGVLAWASLTLSGCGDDSSALDGGTDATTEDGGMSDGGDSAVDAAQDVRSDVPVDVATDVSDSGIDSEIVVRGFVDTYVGGMITGREPDLAGAHPVFIFTGDRGAPHDSALAIAWIQRMAQLGFVSAAVEYADGGALGCGPLRVQAAPVYGGALDQVCGRARSDCSRGVVVAGHGQGALVALLAKDVDLRVEAMLGLSGGYDLASGPNHQTCVVTERTLGFNRIRLANGQADDAWGTVPMMRTQLNTITSTDCTAGITDCLAGDGSGWILVQGGETTDGLADHCYFNESDGSMPCASPLDEIWRTTTAQWGLRAGADWLASFGR